MKTAEFGARVRFNWGFHDAQADCVHGQPDRRYVVHQSADNSPPFPLPEGKENHSYRVGYRYGREFWNRVAVRNASSEDAWVESGLEDER